MAPTHLNAARAFAIAARHGGFASAARELGVTAAAVSQHVRNLETYLGKTLFERVGNRIVLTEAGQALYPRLEAALGDLGGALEETRNSLGLRRFVLSASPSLAEHWVLPRLRGLDLSGIDLRSELDPVDFSGNRIDLRLTYGLDQYPEHACAPIYADRIVAVCAPGLLDDGQTLADVPDGLLIHTVWGPSWTDVPSWRAWFAQADIARDALPATGLSLHLTSHAIAAAEAGLGVALAPQELVRRNLASGRLVVVRPDVTLTMDGVYGAIWSHAKSGSRQLRTILRHLGIAGPQ